VFEKMDRCSSCGGKVRRVESTTPIPDPPWWDSPNKVESRSALTREAIVSAAVKVLDEVGLDGLSMRRVAEELGTGAASLYWHVADKEQLIHLVLDRIMGEVELPEPDPEHWEEQIKWFAHAGRHMFQRHRDIALASLGRVPMGPNLVRIAEWMLGVLRSAGIPDREAAWFPDLAALISAAQAIEDDMPSPEEKAMMTAMGDYLAGLPPERFPNITGVLPDLVSGGADERFEFVVELLVRGLATFIKK
jgi:AcrR family transcriptional regulator